MYDMSYSTESAAATGNNLCNVDKRPESTVGQGSVLRGIDENPTLPFNLPVGLGSSVITLDSSHECRQVAIDSRNLRGVRALRPSRLPQQLHCRGFFGSCLPQLLDMLFVEFSVADTETARFRLCCRRPAFMLLLG